MHKKNLADEIQSCEKSLQTKPNSGHARVRTTKKSLKRLIAKDWGHLVRDLEKGEEGVKEIITRRNTEE
ncbi:hypothetical protein V6N12_050235 [Hibiscus sabdariffa]|uniref:Uncharacterized protein n=1 Tax=Hibiscus sabdariffa TaxID=183260 RepID=A0ABR2GC89_9ROSI